MVFEFIKSLFKPKAESEEVKLEELENWFREQIKEKLESLKADITFMFAKFNEEINKLKENLGMLEKTRLQNPNISVREKQIMEGNRQAYIKKVSAFIDNISLEKSPKKVQEFCNAFEDYLDNLDKNTKKPYFVLNEFFGNEVKVIARNIKDLDKNVKEIKSVMERKEIKQIEAVEKEIKNMLSKMALNENFKKKLTEIEQELEEDKKYKEEINSGIEKIKNSEEMRALQQLKKEMENLDERINQVKDPFLHNFAAIEAALKKYSKIALDEKTVLHYLGDPLRKLLKDSDLKILKILENIKGNVNKNIIELKDKKKEKTLQTIEAMDRKYFENFLGNYNQLLDKKRGINKKMEENRIEEKLKEGSLKLNQIDEKIENKNKEIQKLKRELESVKIDGLVRGIEESIERTLNRKVYIMS